MQRLQRMLLAIMSALAITVIAGVSDFVSTTASAQTAGKTMTTPSGLQITDSVAGTGASPKPGQICVMHYPGWLYEHGQKGEEFDSAVDPTAPVEYPMDNGRATAGR